MRYLGIIGIMLLTLLSCKEKKDAAASAEVYYTCSMHPQIRETDPNVKCPICHMDLIAIKQQPAGQRAAATSVMLSDQQVQLGNIRVDTLRSGTIGSNIIFTGTLAIDQTKTTSVSARVMGRIDRLYFKNIGDPVGKGDPLFDLYSEELNTAKQDYRLALQKRKELTNATIDFNQIVESARRKLLLWGMSEGQIAALERSRDVSLQTTFYSPASGYITSLDALEGQYVMDGGTIMKLADLSTLWVEAQAYASQMGNVRQGTAVSVEFPETPGQVYQGTVEFINPEINPDTRLSLFRVSVPNQQGRLRPGMPAYVTLKGRQTTALTLPVDAVIRDGRSNTVWIQTGKNTYENRMVTLGTESEGFVEIREGLKAGDVVVVSGAYLLNSEYIFKNGADPMAGHDMSNM